MSSFFDKGIKSYRNASNLGEKKLARNIWCKRKKGVTTRLTRTGSVNSDATSLHADPKWPSAVRRSGSSGEGAIDARYRAIPAPLQLPWRPSPDPLLQWESETPETHRQSRRGTEQRSQALSLSPRVFVSLKWERERENSSRGASFLPSAERSVEIHRACRGFFQCFHDFACTMKRRDAFLVREEKWFWWRPFFVVPTTN